MYTIFKGTRLGNSIFSNQRIFPLILSRTGFLEALTLEKCAAWMRYVKLDSNKAWWNCLKCIWNIIDWYFLTTWLVYISYLRFFRSFCVFHVRLYKILNQNSATLTHIYLFQNIILHGIFLFIYKIRTIHR